MIAIYAAYKTESSGPMAYTAGYDTVRAAPIAILPWRLALQNFSIGVAPLSSTPELNAAVDALIAHIDATYPSIDFATLGGVGLGPLVGNVTVPKLSAQVTRLADGPTITSIVKSTEYGTTDDTSPLRGAKLWAAIVINAYDSATKRIDYTIRMNESEVPSTRERPTNNVARNPFNEYAKEYALSVYETAGPPFLNDNRASFVIKLPKPGFVSLQLLVDRWAINATAARPLPQATVDALWASFTGLMQSQGGVNNATVASWNATGLFNASSFAAAKAAVADWMRAETMAPQVSGAWVPVALRSHDPATRPPVLSTPTTPTSRAADGRPRALPDG